MWSCTEDIPERKKGGVGVMGGGGLTTAIRVDSVEDEDGQC